MPESGPPRRRPNPQPQPEPAKPVEATGKSWSWISKLGAATFGTIIAPILVAFILKVLDPSPPPASPASTAVTATAIAPAGATPLAAPQEQKADTVPVVAPDAQTTVATVPPGATAPARNSDPPIADKQPETASKEAPTETSEGTTPATAEKAKKKRKLAAAKDQLNDEQAAQFRYIFNGRDLSGWRPIDPQRWSVNQKNKWLVGEHLPGDRKEIESWIYSGRDFTDFRLRVEFRIKPNTDTGIIFRTQPNTKLEEHCSIQLTTDPESDLPTGTILGLRSDARHPHTRPKSPVSLKSPPQWNNVLLEIRGMRLQLTINEELIHDVRMDERNGFRDANLHKVLPSGRIGLQSRTGHVEFRNIQLQELDSPSPKP